jgi:hypothetical protein
MAYSTGRKQCVMDGSCKQAAIYGCQGCSQAFCSKHIADHRRKLGNEMNEIISEHDHLKNTFTQHTTDPNQHPLIKQIDEWEKESIAKIQQKAKELREQLLQPAATQINELSKRLEPLSEQLTTGRELDDFVEPDLVFWKGKLDSIKSDLVSPLKFSINQDDNAPLVRNISVILKTVNEWFDRVFDDKVRIEEDGEVVIHNGPKGNKEIRGKIEYTSGCHQIRLRIEYAYGSSIFLGINSKSTPLQSESYSQKTAYLWHGNNYIYSNGSAVSNGSNPPIEMKKNDIITLIFDCDNLKISMINERSNAKHELTIDINNCPFPWQLHVNLSSPLERIRILPQ